MSDSDYKEILEMQGVKIPFFPNVISERMRNLIERGRYEIGEVRMLQKVLRKGDKVLELGAGVGLISSIAAQITGPENVIAVEANPNLIPVIKETHSLNGLKNLEVLNGIGVSDTTSQKVSFYLREDFWASSLTRPVRRDKSPWTEVQVSQINLNSLIEKQKTNVLVMDIEGAELDLLYGLNLASINTIVVELHPRVYKLKGVDSFFQNLHEKGFTYNPKQSRGGTVVVFSRFAPDATKSPRVTAVTCMKDEAPFILEWIAYHKAVGITDFLVFTNDCTDGTLEILDRLDALGIVRHLPNISTAIGSERHQPAALSYAIYHSEYKNADWVISMDVDEFINIHIGDHTLNALFTENKNANVISLCHLDFGCGGIAEYQDIFLTKQMTLCDHLAPKEFTRRGVKTLIHKSAPAYKFSNHRPHFQDPEDPLLKWIDGAGRPDPDEIRTGIAKGIDCRGAYEQVQLNHYPVRSMETYLTKTAKGNVIAINKFHGAPYWKKRNKNADEDTSIQAFLPKTQENWNELIGDPALAKLHNEAVDTHKKNINTLLEEKKNKAFFSRLKTLHRKYGTD
ncbi:MAG: FkbM family methyltransferase [Amylibacter sp.]